MAVSIEDIKPGAVFKFKTANRVVTACTDENERGFMVAWQYADGRPRAGRVGGSQWVHYFRTQAIECLPGADGAGETVTLRASGRSVPRLSTVVEIKVLTKSPGKYAVVDMETGDVWGHDGHRFRRMTADECGEVAEVARESAQAADRPGQVMSWRGAASAAGMQS